MGRVIASGTIAKSSYDVWRQAHASGNWESARQGWPILRAGFLNSANTSWPTFAGPQSSPLQQTAAALGTARLAYRLGDADIYALACARFARALTQLTVQERGAKYFREHQPWHSMEPLAESLALSHLTTDGWQFTRTNFNSSVETNPDLARLLRAAQQQLIKGSAAAPLMKLERLIPGHPPTEFLAAPENVSESRGLATRLHASPAAVSLQWSEWKTMVGGPWDFGATTVTPKPVGGPREIRLNANTRVVVYPGP